MKCQQIRNITESTQIKQLFKSRVLTKNETESKEYYPIDLPPGMSTLVSLNYLA